MFLKKMTDEEKNRYDYLNVDMFRMMRAYNWLLSDENPSLKWATEKLNSEDPNAVTAFGDTYENVYKNVLKKSVPFNRKRLAKSYFESKTGNYGIVAVYDEGFDKFNNEFKDYEYGHSPLFLTYLLSDIELFREFHRNNDWAGLKFTDLETSKKNFEDLLSGKRDYILTSAKGNELFAFAEVLMQLEPDAEKRKIIRDKIDDDIPDVNYFCNIYENVEEREAILKKALYQGWHSAIYLLMIVPMFVEHIEKALKKKDSKLIYKIARQKVFPTFSFRRFLFSRDIEWYKETKAHEEAFYEAIN